MQKWKRKRKAGQYPKAILLNYNSSPSFLYLILNWFQIISNPTPN